MTAEELSELVAGVWAATLGVPRVDPDADFFALGGNSLHAVHILAALEAELGLHLSVRTLLETRTPRLMAAHLSAHAP